MVVVIFFLFLKNSILSDPIDVLIQKAVIFKFDCKQDGTSWDCDISLEIVKTFFGFYMFSLNVNGFITWPFIVETPELDCDLKIN
jgi:hypothetical protein